MAAVLGRAALIADRPRGLDGELGRALDQRSGVSGWPSSACSAAVARTWHRRDRRQRDARLGAARRSASVSCEATPTTAMSSSRRGVWRR